MTDFCLGSGAFDPPTWVSAPTHRIRPLVELDAADAAVARATSSRLVVAADRISTSLAAPRTIHAELAALVGHIDCVIAGLSGQAFSFDISSEDESRAALERTLDRATLRLPHNADPAAVVNATARYDAYFGARRREHLEPDQFLCQVLVTASLVFRDLGRCMLDTNEIVMILRATAAGISVPGDTAALLQEPTDAVYGFYEEEVPADQIWSMALWRWKVGHHLFSQYAIMSYHLIEAASAATSFDAKAACIDRLCHTYRGATAAMWYAVAFPSQLYSRVVRPSMEQASRDGSGFSGIDSLDFRLMKVRLREMLAEFEAELGAADTWPETLWQAVWQLYEVQQLDLEHHVLIAQKVVGNAPSLKQVRMAERCGGRELMEMSGVDTLRGMAAERANAKAKFLTG